MSQLTLSKARIMYQPLGEEIHIAELDKSGRRALAKTDRTHDFLTALLRWCEPGQSRTIVDENGNTIAVVRVDKSEALLTREEQIEEALNRR